MSETLALAKTIRDGRTATVVVHHRDGRTWTTAHLGGREIGNHCGPHHLSPNLPSGHVAAVGQLCLTASEAAQVEAAYSEVVAAVPRDPLAARDVLARRLRAVIVGASDDREAAWDAFDGGGNPFIGDAAAANRIAEARASLDAFDVAHPDVAAQVAADTAAARLRALHRAMED